MLSSTMTIKHDLLSARSTIFTGKHFHLLYKKKLKKIALINMLLAKYENKTIVILKKVNGGV